MFGDHCFPILTPALLVPCFCRDDLSSITEKSKRPTCRLSQQTQLLLALGLGNANFESMATTKKALTTKRRHQDMMAATTDYVRGASVESLGDVQEDSIESLLAEMAGTTAAPVIVPTAPSANGEPPSSIDKELFDPSLLGTTNLLSSDQRNRIAIWNRAMQIWQSSGSYTPGLLPSFDVEVARHFKVQSLSSYLLEACEGLKMPAFERWYDESLKFKFALLETLFTFATPPYLLVSVASHFVCLG